MEQNFPDKLKEFENQWVVLADNKVVASGKTAVEAKEKAEKAGRHEYVFYFVPSSAASFAPATIWD